ncbi:MAG: hypothetical protein CMJ32_05525 [Phycisphaerae bacterium]|nr:hypothetical protein [Phycisphaerae bacterium]
MRIKKTAMRVDDPQGRSVPGPLVGYQDDLIRLIQECPASDGRVYGVSVIWSRLSQPVSEI